MATWMYILIFYESSEIATKVFHIPYPNLACTVSRNAEVDSKILNFNGHAHFFCLCCGPITIVVQLDPVLHSLENRGFHVTSNPTDSDEKYTIPSEEDRVKLHPVGIWPLMEQLTRTTMDDSNQLSRFISSNFSKSIFPGSAEVVPSIDIPLEFRPEVMIPICFLPKGYEVFTPSAYEVAT